MDWDAAEEIWRYKMESGLKATGKHPAIITENIGNARANREKMAKIFFEKLHMPSLYVVAPLVLALYASGRISGVLLDIRPDCTGRLERLQGVHA